MTARAERMTVPVTMLALVLAMLVDAASLTRVARLVPLAVAVPTVLLIVVELVRRSGHAKSGRDLPRPESTAGVGRLEAQMLAWLLVLCVCVAATGAAPGLAVFTCVYLRVASRAPLPRAAAVSFVTYAVLHLLFQYVLHAPVWSGWLRPV
jgi:hypothetical protein